MPMPRQGRGLSWEHRAWKPGTWSMSGTRAPWGCPPFGFPGPQGINLALEHSFLLEGQVTYTLAVLPMSFLYLLRFSSSFQRQHASSCFDLP